MVKEVGGGGGGGRDPWNEITDWQESTTGPICIPGSGLELACNRG